MDKAKMVETDYLQKVVRELELFLIELCGFRFDGSHYSMILFIPLLRKSGQYKYNLILSSVVFDRYSTKEIISEIFKFLSKKLSSEEANKIESIVIANSNSPFVKNLNFLNPIKSGITEYNDLEVGSVKIHRGILIYSNLLQKLKENNAIHVELRDGKLISMGIKRINKNLNIVFYTGKGLRELFSNNRTEEEKEKARLVLEKSEEELKAEKYLDEISLNEIKEVK